MQRNVKIYWPKSKSSVFHCCVQGSSIGLLGFLCYTITIIFYFITSLAIYIHFGYKSIYYFLPSVKPLPHPNISVRLAVESHFEFKSYKYCLIDMCDVVYRVSYCGFRCHKKISIIFYYYNFIINTYRW